MRSIVKGQCVRARTWPAPGPPRQQAAEKLLKGFLAAAGVGFRKTNDLRELGDAVVISTPAAAALVRQTENWTVWGVAYRYPAVGDVPEPEPSATALRHALAMIRQLAAALRALEPR